MSILAPPACLICRAALVRTPAGPALCGRCRAALDAAPGARLDADGIDGGFAALPYSGAGRRLVAALKFGRLRSAAELAAALIEARAPPELLTGTLVPVPPSPLRLAWRGFDPAREIALALAARSGLAAADPLRRRDLRRQRGGGRERRMRRPPRIAAATPAPAVVIVVDDVVTTGATLDACARALRGAGSTRVRALSLAAVRSRRQGPG